VSRFRIAVLFALVSVVPSVAQAQQASIIGTIVDDTKAVLPGVSVTATDQAAGRQISSVTNERGEYRLLNVPAGKYTVVAELAGFSTVILLIGLVSAVAGIRWGCHALGIGRKKTAVTGTRPH